VCECAQYLTQPQRLFYPLVPAASSQADVADHDVRAPLFLPAQNSEIQRKTMKKISDSEIFFLTTILFHCFALNRVGNLSQGTTPVMSDLTSQG